AIGDKIFVDGGVRANMPAYAARDTGAGLVIGVLVDQPLTRVPAKEFRKSLGVASRLLDVVLDTGDERQIPYADLVIRPDIRDIPILSKDPADPERAIAAGEEAARKALPEIRRLLSIPPATASAPVQLHLRNAKIKSHSVKGLKQLSRSSSHEQ
ncbi:MAG TPA: hypothetical protein VFA15_06855, partial [Nitrososphaera sp.]|nr:hypothetical protein [Nitrososphaera sp.]